MNTIRRNFQFTAGMYETPMGPVVNTLILSQSLISCNNLE